MSAPLKITNISDNVFNDIGFQKYKEQSMLLHKNLMHKIERIAKKDYAAQSEAAKCLASPGHTSMAPAQGVYREIQPWHLGQHASPC